MDWTSRFSKKVDELKNNLQPKTSDASSSNQEKTKLSTKQRPYVLSKEVSFRPRDECFDKNKEYTIHVRWVFENIPEFDSSKGILNARVGMGPLYDYFVHSDKAFVELNAPAPIPGVYTFEYSVYGFENRDNSLLEIILPEYCDGSKTPERIERQPMPDQSDVESDTKQLENTKEGRNVAVLLIKDHYYPIKQFILAHPDECKSDHYHSYFPQVHSIDGVYIGDEKKSGCGFGTVEEIPKTEKFMTQDQINTFEKDMGFEP
ncbi:MAG: hypothetical protein EPO63_00215 [Candidatus Nitrosotenuis sp.]|nr:MAG: hypothetical protein EPO63_00215 [Candidatus Nitrosotenuis sp.]